MNIFGIPSWYPSSKSSISGIFFREQAQAIGEKSDHKVILSLWGQGNFTLPINRPWELLGNLGRYFISQPSFCKISKNTYEFFEPSLSFHLSLVLRANEENFKKAEKKFGKMDLIVAYVSYPAGWVAMKLAQKYKIPYVIREVMGPFPFPDFLDGDRLSPIIREPLDKAKEVIAISPSLARDIEKFGVRHVVSLPFMINGDFFKPARNHSRGITFLTLATVCEDKGIGDLLQAVRLVIKKRPEIQFRIGGAGPELDFYKNEARLLGVDKNIKWLGWLNRRQARREYQNCQGFVLPTHHDTFSMVCAEAIACGKPVISTRSGGPESIINSQNGILVKVGDYRELSRAILNLSENLEKYSTSWIRRDFLSRFSKKAVSKKLISHYERVVKNVRDRRGL